MHKKMSLSRRQLKTRLKQVEADMEALADLYINEPPPTPPVFIWTTYDHREIPLTEMDDRHLQNSICWAQRNLVRKFGEVRYLEDLALTIHSLHEFLKEAVRRGLRV